MCIFRSHAGMTQSKAAAIILAAACGTAAFALLPQPARAECCQVFLPHVVKGEVEFEHRGHLDFDDDGTKDKASNQKFSLGYGVTEFWFTEVEYEAEKENRDEQFNNDALELENVFQLTPQGKYWADLGGFFKYEFGESSNKAPDEVEFGPILSKTFGRTEVTLNPFFVKEVGVNAEKGLEFTYGAQARYRLMPEFEPGVEAFGDPGEIHRFDRISKQTHQIGPVAFGKFRLGDRGQLGSIGYELGVLFGLTEGSPDRTLKWAIEYEYHF